MPPRAPALPAAALLGTLAALVIVPVSAGWDPLVELDTRVAHALHDAALAHPGWTRTARILTDWVWDTVTMRILAAVVVLALWFRARRRLALLVALAVLAGALVQQALKAVLGRDRPVWQEPVDTAHYAALPSGHAMTAALVCGLLVWLVWSRTALPRPRRAALRWTVAATAAVSVGGVSLTRVYLGVHWLTDVVAGVLLGLAIAVLAAGAWRPWRR